MDLNQASSISMIERYKRGAFPADGLILPFTMILLIIGIFNYNRLGQPYIWISTDFGIIILLWMLISRDKREDRRLYYWLHFLWPIIAIGFLYSQCTAWDNLIFPHTFDPLLKKWDHALWGFSLNKVMAPTINRLWVDELMHAFYFSYYLMLFLPVSWLFWHRQSQAFEIVFSLSLMIYSHLLFFMIFPGDGPISDRSDLFGRGVVFIPLMNFIYRLSDQGGGGAFPSTHVSSVVLIFLYFSKYFPKMRLPFGIGCLGIIIATVYCSYHYSIDAIAGVLTGTIFYFIGQYVYAHRFNPATHSFFAMQQSA